MNIFNYMPCNQKSTKSIEVPSRYCGKTGYFQHLCPEHAAFVKDCITPIVQTSEGLRHLKEIKAMFNTHNRKPRICPRCGFAA